MLGSLPKLFDKNFVIGFYLPALLAVIASAWAFPSLPMFDSVRSLLTFEKKLGDLTYLAVIVWVLAILLMTFNQMQYRLLEGYLPPVSWLFPLRWWHRWRFRRLNCQYEKLVTKWQVAVDKGQDLSEREQDRTTFYQYDERRIIRLANPKFYQPDSAIRSGRLRSIRVSSIVRTV